MLSWNVYFLAQNIVLFGIASQGSGIRDQGSGKRIERPGLSRSVLTPDPWPLTPRRTAAAIRGLLVFALIFPLTEPFGLCDVWPAWAVYATGPERLRVTIDAADRQRLPAALQRLTDAPRFVDGRCLCVD